MCICVCVAGVCNVWLCMCVDFVMYGCFGNVCTCIYCVLYCLYFVFVLFRLSVTYPGICSREGVQQIQLRTEDRKNGDPGDGSP